MAPFATMILGIPLLLLEGNGVIELLQTPPTIESSLVIIFTSEVLAFCLNFSIVYVIHSITAVTFNVAGNLKNVACFGNLLVRLRDLHVLDVLQNLATQVTFDDFGLFCMVSWATWEDRNAILNYGKAKDPGMAVAWVMDLHDEFQNK
ncbi:hypothetical protein Dsin_015584 [Dipteronia sinensis]|uniref:Uncharacterized protein n=1 Tax=Dipteronia sinensis TaxID=43782 RepID=A0AAE0E646_9ROSI|nr:hypothetical protein Dsin_015584 [Dipteronia sinensis]